MHYGPKPEEDDLLFHPGQGWFRLYNPQADPAPMHAPIPEPSRDGDEETRSGFADESDLRDYPARNLSLLEPKLESDRDGEDMTGVEFPAGDRPIHLLAVNGKGN